MTCCPTPTGFENAGRCLAHLLASTRSLLSLYVVDRLLAHTGMSGDFGYRSLLNRYLHNNDLTSLGADVFAALINLRNLYVGGTEWAT